MRIFYAHYVCASRIRGIAQDFMLQLAAEETQAGQNRELDVLKCLPFCGRSQYESLATLLRRHVSKEGGYFCGFEFEHGHFLVTLWRLADSNAGVERLLTSDQYRLVRARL